MSDSQRLMDDAVSAYVNDVNNDGARMVIGWVLLAAVKDINNSEDGAVSHVYDTAPGQPVYATLGLIEVGRAAIRQDTGVVGAEDDD